MKNKIIPLIIFLIIIGTFSSSVVVASNGKSKQAILEEIGILIKSIKSNIDYLRYQIEIFKEEKGQVIERKVYTNRKYGFEIKLGLPGSLTIEEGLSHDWGDERHPNMERCLWDISFFDANRYYGYSESRKTGVPIIKITVNECFDGEEIEDCLLKVTSPCGTVPYGRLEEIYSKYGESSGKFNFSESTLIEKYPSLDVGIFCINTGNKGIAVMKDGLLYNIMLFSRNEYREDYSNMKPLPEDVIEPLLSNFKFIEEELYIKILSPNGGEILIENSKVVDSLSSVDSQDNIFEIKWSGAPDSFKDVYGNGKDPARIETYLEQNDNGQFITIGRIIPHAYGSIKWIVGQVSDINCLMNNYNIHLYPNHCFRSERLVNPGNYYLRIIDTKTGAMDRSDNYFSIVSPVIE